MHDNYELRARALELAIGSLSGTNPQTSEIVDRAETFMAFLTKEVPSSGYEQIQRLMRGRENMTGHALG